MASINLDTAQKLDITVRRGDTLGLQLTITNPTNNNPMDLTGIIVRMHVKYFDTIILAFAIGSGIVISNPTNGIIQLVKSKEEMNDITPDTYNYDLEFTYPSGERKTAAYGTFKINADETR